MVSVIAVAQPWALGNQAAGLPGKDVAKLNELQAAVSALAPTASWDDGVIRQFNEAWKGLSDQVKTVKRSLSGFRAGIKWEDRLQKLNLSLDYLHKQATQLGNQINAALQALPTRIQDVVLQKSQEQALLKKGQQAKLFANDLAELISQVTLKLTQG